MTADVSSYHFFAGSQLHLTHSKSSVGITVMAQADCSKSVEIKVAGKGSCSKQKMDSLEHVCKICDRSFACGRALGGHMRIHGSAATVQFSAPDDLMHSQKKKKRRVSEIGARNGSSESMFTKPSSDRGHLHRTSPVYEACAQSDLFSEEQVMQRRNKDGNGASLNPTKRWRSKLPRYAAEPPHTKAEQSLSTSLSLTDEDQDVANCLVMLSTAQGSWRPAKAELPEEENKLGGYYVCGSKNPMEKIASASKTGKDKSSDSEDVEGESKKNEYKCRTCKKVFHSHQALGGHRASHNKESSSEEEMEMEVSATEEKHVVIKQAPTPSEEKLHVTAKKSKVHECPICHRIFGSGQALGGHKRCHWISTSCPTPSPTTSSPKNRCIQKDRPALLDLNLPAPVDDEDVDYVNDKKPCNLLNSMEAHHSNNICYYTPQWWIDSHYRIFPLPPPADAINSRGNFKPEIHRPWLQVTTKTT